jgi:hypothetical protein
MSSVALSVISCLVSCVASHVVGYSGVHNILKLPSNDDRPNYQGGIGGNDPFTWEVERVVQYFNSIISSLTFKDALHSHQITRWILLWEISSEVLREELLIGDLAQ